MCASIWLLYLMCGSDSVTARLVIGVLDRRMCGHSAPEIPGLGRRHVLKWGTDKRIILWTNKGLQSWQPEAGTRLLGALGSFRKFKFHNFSTKRLAVKVKKYWPVWVWTNSSWAHQCSSATRMGTEEAFGWHDEFLADDGAVMGLHHPSSLEKSSWRCRSQPELVKIQVSGRAFWPGSECRSYSLLFGKWVSEDDPHNYKSVFEGVDLVLRLHFWFRFRSGLGVRGQGAIGRGSGPGFYNVFKRHYKMSCRQKHKDVCVGVGVSVRASAEWISTLCVCTLSKSIWITMSSKLKERSGSERVCGVGSCEHAWRHACLHSRGVKGRSARNPSWYFFTHSYYSSFAPSASLLSPWCFDWQKKSHRTNEHKSGVDGELPYGMLP